MPTELVNIDIGSCYKSGDKYVNLPPRMAKCVPEFKEAIFNIKSDVADRGGEFRLSDLFRDWDMQHKAHQDYVTGKKSAYSPPPGSSFHEAGRAFDVWLEKLTPLGSGGKNFLEEFWKICEGYKVVPIIGEPNSRKSEAWHFECRGEFGTVRKLEGYKMAVRAAILDIGVEVKEIEDEEAAWVQGQILAYGIDIGPIDGIIGKKTKAAIEKIKKSHGWPHAKTVAADADEWWHADSWLITFLDTLTVRVV